MSEMLETQHFGYFKTQKRKDTEKNEDSASLRLCVFAFYLYQDNLLLGITFFNYVPIYDLPKGSKMVRTAILIVQIISMLPYVKCEQWL